jgi:hypothetical protein
MSKGSKWFWQKWAEAVIDHAVAEVKGEGDEHPAPFTNETMYGVKSPQQAVADSIKKDVKKK